MEEEKVRHKGKIQLIPYQDHGSKNLYKRGGTNRNVACKNSFREKGRKKTGNMNQKEWLSSSGCWERDHDIVLPMLIVKWDAVRCYLWVGGRLGQ